MAEQSPRSDPVEFPRPRPKRRLNPGAAGELSRAVKTAAVAIGITMAAAAMGGEQDPAQWVKDAFATGSPERVLTQVGGKTAYGEIKKTMDEEGWHAARDAYGKEAVRGYDRMERGMNREMANCSRDTKSAIRTLQREMSKAERDGRRAGTEVDTTQIEGRIAQLSEKECDPRVVMEAHQRDSQGQQAATQGEAQAAQPDTGVQWSGGAILLNSDKNVTQGVDVANANAEEPVDVYRKVGEIHTTVTRTFVPTGSESEASAPTPGAEAAPKPTEQGQPQGAAEQGGAGTQPTGAQAGTTTPGQSDGFIVRFDAGEGAERQSWVYHCENKGQSQEDTKTRLKAALTKEQVGVEILNQQRDAGMSCVGMNIANARAVTMSRKEAAQQSQGAEAKASSPSAEVETGKKGAETGKSTQSRNPMPSSFGI